jgi:hypothetical protein
MAAQYFGSTTSNGPLPNTVPKPGGDRIVTIEVAIDNNATGSPTATCQLQGSLSQANWNPIGTTIVLNGSGASGFFTTPTILDYEYYQVVVSAIGGTGTTVMGWMGA